METDGLVVKRVYTDKKGLGRKSMHNEKTYPFLSDARDLWVDDYTVFYVTSMEKPYQYVNSLTTLADKEEVEMYWRYRKAWRLMNR